MPHLMKAAVVLLSLSSLAAAQSGTPAPLQPVTPIQPVFPGSNPQPAPVTPEQPIPVQPAPLPTTPAPAPAAPVIKQQDNAPAPLPQTVTLTAVQRADGLTAWGGLATELLLIPEFYLGLSGPVYRSEKMSVLLRGGVEASVGAALNTELLFKARSGQFYGGPSGGVVFGLVRGWGIGGVLGYQRDLDNGRVGYFVEAKARYVYVLSSSAGPGDQPNRLISPGFRVGFHYRF